MRWTDSTRRAVRRWQHAAMAAACLWLAACGESPLPLSAERDLLQAIRDAGQLTIITRVNPTTYYTDHGQAAGFEYELASEFARELGVTLAVEPAANISQVFTLLNNGDGHLAAAGLSISPQKRELYTYSPGYMAIRHQVIYKAGTPRPRSVGDLVGKRLLVVANSGREDWLLALQQEHPGLQWQSEEDIDTQGLFEQVQKQQVDYAIINSNEFLVHKGFYPNVKVAMEFRQPQYLAWAYPANADEAFTQAIKQFFKRVRSDGTLERLTERYYGHTHDTSQAGALTFYKLARSRLPCYEPLMREIAEEYQLPWKLLAAISYQESHWNPRAQSPTGVRGIMMLTQDTAAEMGVTNRLDAPSNLRGGAQYFRKILDRLPDSIVEPDRTWIALAAYNVGYGHLQDARFITDFRGYDPDRWNDIKKHLPLLEDRDWYPYTQYGKARGSEPVIYVHKIRNYYNLLAWHEEQRAQHKTPARCSVPLPPAPALASSTPASGGTATPGGLTDTAGTAGLPAQARQEPPPATAKPAG